MKPSSRFWHWGRTALKSAFFLAVCLVTLAVLAAAALSFSGRRDWARVKMDLLARGERLSLAELQPPAIPAEQDFFADPLWMELTDLVEVETDVEGLKVRQKQIRVPKGERQLDGLNRPLTVEEQSALRTAFPDQKVPDNANAANLIHTAFQAGRELDPDARRRNAEFILEVLPLCEPVLSRLDDLGRRPGARFAIDPLSEVFLAQSGYLMGYGQILAARTWAELVLGKNEAAQRHAVALLRLPDVLASSPLFVSVLFRVPMKFMGLKAVQDGLKAQAWSDRELAEIERTLATADYPTALAWALRGERGFGNQVFEQISRRDIRSELSEAWSGPGPSVYLWIFGAGEDACRNRIFQNTIDVLDQVPRDGLNARTISVWNRDQKALKESTWNGFRYRITAMGFPNLTNIAKEVARLQDQIAQTRTASALERHRLKYGAYPGTLADLVPEFLPSVPVDIATLQPMKYGRDGETFRLWSPGWDAVDAGGQADDWIWGK